jgi:hypothetical protein
VEDTNAINTENSIDTQKFRFECNCVSTPCVRVCSCVFECVECVECPCSCVIVCVFVCVRAYPRAACVRVCSCTCVSMCSRAIVCASDKNTRFYDADFLPCKRW